MTDKWAVVTISGSWGTDYYIQDKTTGQTLKHPDGSTFRTTNAQLAEKCCEQANREADERN